MDANAKQSELKRLIIKGREQGFLTYREINDHLPDDMNDTDQIEAVVNMINEMGIEVYDAVPDADSLLLKSTVGRTTDPVRMYMREMGTVDLLTRKDEINLAQRIEDGIRQTTEAVATCPAAIQVILDYAEDIKAEKMRLTDLLVGFIDPNAEINANPPQAGAAAQNNDDDEDEEPVDTGPDMEESMERIASIEEKHNQYIALSKEKSFDHPDARKVQQEMIPELMEIKFTPKIIEQLWDAIRTRVETIRGFEKQLMDFSINEANISRKDFIKNFQHQETDDGLYKRLHDCANDKGKATLDENKKQVLATQRKL